MNTSRRTGFHPSRSLVEISNIHNSTKGIHDEATSILPSLAAVALTLSTVGAGAVLDTSPAAAASSHIGSNSGGANVRTCPNTGCFSKTYLRNGTPVTMVCWVDSQWVHPPNSDYSSNRWFKIGGYVGYVHSSLVENQTSVPRCP